MFPFLVPKGRPEGGARGRELFQMTDMERYGRILLTIAVLGLFLTIVASMIVGRYLTPTLVIVAVFGIVGFVMMRRGKGSL